MNQCATSLVLIAILAGCGNRELILEGERLDIRDGTVAVEPSDATRQDEIAEEAAANLAVPIDLPAPQNISEWTHRNGSAQHHVTHPALGTSLAQVWSTNIGSGDSRRFRVTADPVVSGGLVFTMDSRSVVSAVDAATGEIRWSRDLTPAFDRNPNASSGGLAVVDGVLAATTGYGQLFSIDAATGDENWNQRLDAPATGAPTIVGDIIYTMSRDGRAWAVNIDNGRVRWELPGAPSSANVEGGAGPAVAGNVAIFPYGSGDVVASLPQGGIRVWNASVAGQRRGRAYADISDVTGDPVINNGRLYVGNSSGRLAAINLTNGSRIWTANEGTLSPVWPEGGSIFMVSDESQLMRLDADTGETIWAIPLPYFENRRERRRKGIYAHYGPIVAGGRVIVPSSDGVIRIFDPVDGTLVETVDLPRGATTNPAIANGTLYVVNSNGQLLAYR
nr:PQQ-like beta-propeller repeat protein [Cochlodiniinecator piscidefendens]